MSTAVPRLWLPPGLAHRSTYSDRRCLHFPRQTDRPYGEANADWRRCPVGLPAPIAQVVRSLRRSGITPAFASSLQHREATFAAGGLVARPTEIGLQRARLARGTEPGRAAAGADEDVQAVGSPISGPATSTAVRLRRRSGTSRFCIGTRQWIPRSFNHHNPHGLPSYTDVDDSTEPWSRRVASYRDASVRG